MERFNGEVRQREKVMRTLKRTDTPILSGYRIYHNYIPPHEGLDGKNTIRSSGNQGSGREQVADSHPKREPQIRLTLTTTDHQFYIDTQREALRLSKTYGFRLRHTFYATSPAIPDVLLKVTFEIGRDIMVGLFSNWLYDKLKHRDDTFLSMDGVIIPIDKRAIKRIINSKSNRTKKTRPRPLAKK